MLSPYCRVTVPCDGWRSPVSNLNSVVLPVPFLPTTPHRSPALTVKVISRNRVVAPKSTPAPPTEICVIRSFSPAVSASRGEPALPRRFRRADGERVAVTHERHLQQQWLIHQDLQPPLVAVACGAKSQVGETLRALVDQRLHAELLGEAHQLAP